MGATEERLLKNWASQTEHFTAGLDSLDWNNFILTSIYYTQ